MAIVIGDPNSDFASQNPKLCTIKEFNEVYRKYPQDASKILWASYFYSVLSDVSNPYSKIHSNIDRLQAIKDEYFPLFDVEVFKSEIELIEKFAMDKAEYLFNIHILKLEEITQHYKSINMSDPLARKEYTELAKLMPSLWKEYERLQKLYFDTKKKKKDIALGGGNLSGSEVLFDN